MKKVLMTNISSKGQVVIPSAFRKSMGLTPGMPLAVFTDGNTLLLKPIELPNPNEFSELLADSRAAAKKTGLKKSTLSKTIKKIRRENCS